MRLLNKTRGSARDQIAIKAVIDDTLVIADGRYRLIMETSTVNLELKSEAEQDAIIDIFQSFLNGLNGPLQILVRTREVEADSFLAAINLRLKEESQPAYRDQLHGYAKFLKGLISVNRILSRNFYIVIEYDSDPKTDLPTVQEQLALQADIVAKGLQRLGMRCRQLSGLEILNLFYSFYNPKAAKSMPLSEKALRLMHSAIVKEET